MLDADDVVVTGVAVVCCAAVIGVVVCCAVLTGDVVCTTGTVVLPDVELML